MQHSQPSLRTARSVVGALFIAPLVFFGLVSFLIGRFGGGLLPPDSGFTARTALWIWLAIAVGCVVIALTMRNRVVARVDEARFVTDPGEASATLADVQTRLIIAASLFEMAALVAGVFFLLFAASDFLWVGLATLAVGVATVFPRAEWFESLERARDAGRAEAR
ncbi:MAG TPA: hypothetical protein VKZ58_11735 [Longimicrobiales bacterium]|nr:hypothetical protein [Longimicrobiales bacterium]